MKLFIVILRYGDYEQEQYKIDSVWLTREEAEARQLEAEQKWKISCLLLGKARRSPDVVSTAPSYYIKEKVIGEQGDTLLPLNATLAYAYNDPATLGANIWEVSWAILEGLTERYMAAVTDEERDAIKAETVDLTAKGKAAWDNYRSNRIETYRLD